MTGCNGIFNVTNENNKFYFKKAIKDEDFIQTAIPPGAYEIESLNNEIKRTSFEKSHYTDTEYPFRIKQNFSTLGSIVEKLSPGSMISFVFDDSVGILLGFNEILMWAKYILSNNPVDILSFDIIFIETNISRALIFKGEQTVSTNSSTMDVNPGYKYIEKFRGGVQWYIMESKDIISSICFKLKE